MVDGIVANYTGIPFCQTKIGDTIIFTPVINNVTKDIIDVDFLSQMAEVFAKAFPTCKIIMSPIDFNIQVIRNEE